MKRIISILVSITLLLGLSVNAFAYSGNGTEANPYIITTPQELQNMNLNLSAHYRLGCDIDMDGFWYEPVGNDIDGAFTGSLDGNGYKIKNLDLDLEGSKYVGLFGYLNGTAKNINLVNVTVCGYKYVGGIAGYSKYSEIFNCTVDNNSNISCSILIESVSCGGIAGYIYNGTIIKCTNYSTVSSLPSVLSSSSKNYTRTGGIVGYDYYGTITECKNYGSVLSSPSNYSNVSSLSIHSYTGGIAGFDYYGTITECKNYSEVLSSPLNYSNDQSSSTYSYAGGIVGYGNNGTISNCENYGEVSSSASHNHYKRPFFYAYDGGIIGYDYNGEIIKCTNYGDILSLASVYGLPALGSGYSYTSGIAGCVEYGAISNCANYGVISSVSHVGGITGTLKYGTITKCINYGAVSSSSSYDVYAGGIVDYLLEGTISNCANYGAVSSSTSGISSYSGAGGIVTNNYSGTITNCTTYSSLSSYSPNSARNSLGVIHATIGNNSTETNCYYNRNINNVYSGRLLNTQCKEQNSYKNFDFENTWFIDANTNSGFPQLCNMPRHMDLNESILFIKKSQTSKLKAYIDSISESVTWSSDDKSIATVSSNGTVTGVGFGTCTITATNSEGMKANCLVTVYDSAENMSFEQQEYTLVIGNTIYPKVVQTPNSTPEEVYWKTDNTSVATVDKYSGAVKAVKSGTATITATTIDSGISASCMINVTGSPVTKITLSQISANINKDSTLQLTPTVTPSAYDGIITWSSSNDEIATVDENGLVTAKYPGMAYIYAQAKSGITAQCTVTVKAPSTVIKLNKSELTLQKGFTEKLITTILPEYSTDTVTWSSSNTNYATVSSDGIITAKAVGQVIISAMTTSGQKAYCTVNIVNPTISVSSVMLDKTELIMTKADIAQLNASILPTNATNQNFIWSSSDESVATVSNTGVVTAVDSGTAIITAASNNGMYHECVVKVISASGMSVVMSNAKASPNGTAQVKANIVKNKGISAYKFTVVYDDSVLTPVSITPNSNFGGRFTTNIDDNDKSKLNVVWYSEEDTNANGELFTVNFAVSDTASLGDTSTVSVEYGAKDICNTKGEYMALYVQDGSVTIADVTPGDVFEDDEVTVYDLTLLARYITGLEAFTDRQKEAGDVNNDSFVDIKDVVKLSQYIAGWSNIQLMSMLFGSAEDRTKPMVSLGSVKADETGKSIIPVSIKNNSGIAGFRYVIDYNSDDIEILEITSTDILNANDFRTNLGHENENGNTDGLVVTWYQNDDLTTDCTLFNIKVRFKNPDINVAPISIKANDNNICDSKTQGVIADYETGYLMKECYIVDNVKADAFSCDLYFNDSFAEQDAVVLVAFYDEAGKLVQMSNQQIAIKPGKVEIQVDIDNKPYSTYKIMVWDSLTSLRPLVKAK